MAVPSVGLREFRTWLQRSLVISRWRIEVQDLAGGRGGQEAEARNAQENSHDAFPGALSLWRTKTAAPSHGIIVDMPADRGELRELRIVAAGRRPDPCASLSGGLAVQEFPHHYAVKASADADTNVMLESPGLDALESAGPAEFGGPGDRWSPETEILRGPAASRFGRRTVSTPSS